MTDRLKSVGRVEVVGFRGSVEKPDLKPLHQKLASGGTADADNQGFQLMESERRFKSFVCGL